MSLEFASDDSKHENSGIDVSVMCMSRANRTSFIWEDRRNAFEQDNECYQCGPCHENALCIVGEGEFTCNCSPGKHNHLQIIVHILKPVTSFFKINEMDQSVGNL